jgi:hypothetical protein
MAISYPLSLPSVKGPSSIVIRAMNTIGVLESPFSYVQQVQDFAGDRWEADVILTPMKRADAEQWNAKLLALRGRYGTFVLGDFVNTSPRGTWSGTPLVNGASQTGETLAIDGVSVGATALAGDWFQLGSGSTSRLYKVLQDATANGSGQMTLDIWPQLRTSPANNDALTLSSPKGLWRLASNTREWSIETAQIYGLRFSAIEAL